MKKWWWKFKLNDVGDSENFLYPPMFLVEQSSLDSVALPYCNFPGSLDLFYCGEPRPKFPEMYTDLHPHPNVKVRLHLFPSSY